MQKEEIQRKGLVDVMQEGECSISASLRQCDDDKLSIQTQSPVDNNKRQQLGEDSQKEVEESSPQNNNNKSNSILSKKIRDAIKQKTRERA